MAIEICVRAGVDSAVAVWRSDFIPDCRGFALHRRIKRSPDSAKSPNSLGVVDARGFVEEIVASWVGFANGADVEPGTRMPTTAWPIQKYLWSDFFVNSGDEVSYRVTPMVGSAMSMLPEDALASDWSPVVIIGAETDGRISCFFNRGIVASQWLARSLPDFKPETSLAKAIESPGNRIRNFLSGPLRQELVTLLEKTNEEKGHIYAALYELGDPELIPLLAKFKKRAHIVLGNGSVKRKGEDQNAEARETLSVCDVRDRMTAPRALAHNKFLVICDKAKKPIALWTGSTNWTRTGLCTQANNALLIRSVPLAQLYLNQWQALAKAGDETPPSLREANAEPKKVQRNKNLTLWFTPMDDQADLDQAGELIASAKQGILFLFFNPGPRGTLFNGIVELASPVSSSYKPDLYIQGVLNQNPGTEKNPIVLFNRGARIGANADVVLPAAISQPLKFWKRELLKLPTAFAMVHSKVIVVDPYGPEPIVMTGSHNLGPKASGVNDENFLIIKGNAQLASQYACNIIEIYNQYRWRASLKRSDEGGPRWQGLADDDQWQIKDKPTDYDKRRLRELEFWFGKA